VRLNDPEGVEREYATENGLLGRRAAYEWATGPDAPELAFQMVAEVAPEHVLEVGCGPGELAGRIQRELGASVVALDISPRMVHLARERDVDARLGDAQDVPFPDASFDCVVAAWMLYHVPDVSRALGEFARVLRPGDDWSP
jgi:ubiquinone/menaquinone biosynthesis C-methylase UbiE